MSENILLRAGKKVFGTQNDRFLKKYNKELKKIELAEEKYKDMGVEELKAQTQILKDKVAESGSLDVVKHDAFAICRLMSDKVLGKRHYDVQIIGGLVLNDGNVAEMKTGEGKTLVATLPTYLRSLSGKQVHVITVNDYLAKRDAELMRPLYEALGLSVSSLQSSHNDEQRKISYSQDIVYGTNSEFAFDYLRKNIAPSIDHQVQKECYFALVDEVDSILIDEARTPLIISGHAEVNIEEVSLMHDIVANFTTEIFKEENGKKISDVESDIALQPAIKQASLTESGYKKLESLLVEYKIIESEAQLYSTDKLYLVKSLETAARAKHLYDRNVDYIKSSDGKIKLINMSTGRIEEGKRWTEGLHQAVEAKEKVEIKPDNTPVASISLQNFFRQYEVISGMTGTADTEATEFTEIYGMDVVVIPPNRPIQRQDEKDKVFIDKDAKYSALIYDIKQVHSEGRPILIGTESVDESQVVAKLLDSEGLKYNLLNAKNHEKEADIVACAGERNAITISTNMAGRGTDILLGGKEEFWEAKVDTDDPEVKQAMVEQCLNERERVKEMGGLHVIGTSRNESRRVDNQLRGRAGRQGDPGSSQFYASFDDSLMKNYGGDRMKALLQGIGVDGGDALQHPMIDKGIAKSQAQSEGQGYKSRAELLKYDDVINKQRMEIYSVRQEWLTPGNKNREDVHEFIKMAVARIVDKFLPSDATYGWDAEGLDLALQSKWGLEPFVEKFIEENGNTQVLVDELAEKAVKHYDLTLSDLKNSMLDNRTIEEIEGELYLNIMVRTLDQYWVEQIHLLDELREGIHLRAYAQKNPLLEFSEGALKLFEQMISGIQVDFVSSLFESCYVTIKGNEMARVQIEEFRKQQAEADRKLKEKIEEKIKNTEENKLKSESEEVFES